MSRRSTDGRPAPRALQRNERHVSGCPGYPAKTPEEVMESALQPAKEGEKEAPAECISRLLLEAEDALKGRLEIIQSAQARLMLCACFVHGVEIPR